MRLIDADALIDRLDERKKMEQGVRNIADILNIQAFIDSQPTAYSVDKVVEELEDRVNEANNNCLCEMHENGHTLDFENENGRIKGLKEAIEVVKQGGVGKESD